MATVGSIETSRPGGNFLKVKPSSCFTKFYMLKIRYMYQIPSAVENHYLTSASIGMFRDIGVFRSLPLMLTSNF